MLINKHLWSTTLSNNYNSWQRKTSTLMCNDEKTSQDIEAKDRT